MTPEEAGAAGWKLARPGAAFNDLAGPFWARQDGGVWRYAALAGSRHVNNRGVVHGGLLLTLADHAMGLTVWEHVGRRPCATIQLDMQFVAAANPGEFIVADVAVVRATRSVVFMRGSLLVDGRTVATADGIWKILGGPPVPAA